MSIRTRIKKVLSRKEIQENEELQRKDLLKANEDKLEDISQRQGLMYNSGLSDAEKSYILSDSMISSAILIYIADITSICDKDSCIIQSDTPVTEKDGEIAKKVEQVRYVFNQIFSNSLLESIIIGLLNNGEIFLDTKYHKGTNSYSVSETIYNLCTQLCFSNGDVAKYAVSNQSTGDRDPNSYSYSFTETKNKFIDPEYMVRIFNPTLSNSKVCVELDKDDDNDIDVNEEYLYYQNSLSLLKQVYPDWLNSKLLELAVYRDRIAKSRFIQLIALELGRTSRQTSDQIYDNVKDYFDKRAVIDLQNQTFKSVVGDEPFIDYKVYITRNGNGKLTPDNSLNNQNVDVAALADLDYNLDKVFAGLGIPKQYLGANDDGSALSNGTSLFFIDEKYQKRVLAYIKRISEGLKQVIKNLIIQREGKDYFYDWDFEIKFQIPENNEDTVRVKKAKVDYVNSLLELVEKLNNDDKFSIDRISSIIGEDLSAITIKDSEGNNEEEEET